MTLAICENLTGRLLDASGTWTENEHQALLFSSFPDAVMFKAQSHLELACVVEYPPRDAADKESVHSDFE